MGQITSAPDGTQIYYNNGQAVNAKTGAAYTPADTTTPTAPTAPVDQNIPGTPTYNPTGGAPINRTVTPGAPDPTGADAAQSYLDNFQQPQTADQIAQAKITAAKAKIDSTNAIYDDQVAAETKAGQDRVSQNNSVSVLSGLMGSTEAARTDSSVKDANSKAVQAINDQRQAALSAIYTKISSDAATEAEQQKQDATKSAQDIVARRTAAQTQALDNVKALAAGGLVDYNSFKNSPQNAQVYQYALNAAGGSDQALAGIFAASRPKDQLVGTPTRVGDHYVQAYQNPVTGKVSYDTVQVPGGLPTEYNKFQTIGDAATGQRIYAIPDNWNGDTSQLKLVASSAGTAGAGASDPSIVAGWVSGIKSGSAKLSDLTGNPTLKNAVVTALAQGGTSQSQILQTTQQSLQQLQDMVDKDNGFSSAVGFKGISSLFGLKSTPIAGTPAADFDIKLNQVKNDVILPNLNLLHGLGRVTDREFQALTSAVTSLSTSQSQGAFKQSLKDIEDQIAQKSADINSSSPTAKPTASDPLGLGI